MHVLQCASDTDSTIYNRGGEEEGRGRGGREEGREGEEEMGGRREGKEKRRGRRGIEREGGRREGKEKREGKGKTVEGGKEDNDVSPNFQNVVVPLLD